MKVEGRLATWMLLISFAERLTGEALECDQDNGVSKMEQTRSLAFLKIALAIYVFAFWLIPPATAGVIGPDNYDFARFGSGVSWSAPGQFVGWTFTTGDFNGDHRIDLLAYAHDADGWRTHLALAV